MDPAESTKPLPQMNKVGTQGEPAFIGETCDRGCPYHKPLYNLSVAAIFSILAVHAALVYSAYEALSVPETLPRRDCAHPTGTCSNSACHTGNSCSLSESTPPQDSGKIEHATGDCCDTVIIDETIEHDVKSVTTSLHD